MKNVIISALLLATTHSALAQTPKQPTVCDAFYEFAHLMMEIRQAGSPLPEALAAVEAESKDLTPSEKKMMQSIVLEAYEHVRFSSKERQQAKIVDFANDMMLACLKNRLARK